MSYCPLCDRDVDAERCVTHDVPTVDEALLDGGPKPATHGLSIASRYRVAARIGAGHSGAVYRAFDVSASREVAIKILHRERLRSREALGRYYREANVLRSLEHPHVIRLLDFGIDRATHSAFIVMPLLLGAGLDKRLADRGPMPIDDVRRLATQILDGLASAHAIGLVHRDIKPANLHLDGDGGALHATILDFGHAKGHGGARTAPGTVLGTPLYMSPEQLSGQALDASTDLYAVGAVLFEALTGRPAFEATSLPALLRTKLAPPPKTDTPLDDVVRALLAPRPDARPASAAEAAALFSSLSSSARPTPTASAGRGNRRVLAAKTGVPDGSEHPATRYTLVAPSPLDDDDAATDLAMTVDEAEQQPVAYDVAPSERSRGPGVAIAVTLAALLAFVGWSLRSRTKTPAPAGDSVAAVARPFATVTTAPKARVTSTPPDAEVVRDGALLGRTPLDVPVGGAVTVRRAGHASKEVVLDPSTTSTHVTLDVRSDAVERPQKIPRRRAPAIEVW